MIFVAYPLLSPYKSPPPLPAWRSGFPVPSWAVHFILWSTYSFFLDELDKKIITLVITPNKGIFQQLCLGTSHFSYIQPLTKHPVLACFLPSSWVTTNTGCVKTERNYDLTSTISFTNNQLLFLLTNLLNIFLSRLSLPTPCNNIFLH